MPIPVRPIARLLTQTLHPPPIMDLSAVGPFFHQLAAGQVECGVMLTVNHYSASDFQSWWFVIPISAVFPVEIHWTVAGGWRHAGRMTGFTRWFFPRGARLLGFTSMPPMPPDPSEAEQRAAAVRQILLYTRTTPRPVIGIAPEGGDQPGGMLGELPSGVGRFMLLISQSCPDIVPVGVWKEAGVIHLNFGCVYRLELPAGLKPADRDTFVGDTVMRRIAPLLPERLRGKYR